MIALKHLVRVVPSRTRPGPYLESWPKIVLLVVVVAVLGGAVAIWNRSHHPPSTAVTHPGVGAPCDSVQGRAAGPACTDPDDRGRPAALCVPADDIALC